MVQEEQVNIAEDLLNEVRPLYNRIATHCDENCDCYFGESDCLSRHCLYHETLSVLHQVDAFLCSNLIDAKLKNGR